MKFGVREIANVVYRAKAGGYVGSTYFEEGQPVLYIDSAKTSILEGTATTVYAQGGRGNTRLIAWEGERTLTFTVEDALLSPIGFAILSGAGLIHGRTGTDERQVHVHTTSAAVISVDADGKQSIDLADALLPTETICPTANLFIIQTEDDGSLTGRIVKNATVSKDGKKLEPKEGNVFTDKDGKDITVILDETGKVTEKKKHTVMVDYYIIRNTDNTYELQIDGENFGGYYYVEADTLFRRQDNGKDMPAVLTLPNVKIQSNFTFNMVSSGDPSTFTFTMDAFPGYTYFDKTKKVLCVIQIIEDVKGTKHDAHTVMGHEDDEVDEIDKDSVVDYPGTIEP